MAAKLMFVILSHVFNKNLNINQTKKIEVGGRKEKQGSVGYLCVDIKYGIILAYCICVCRVFFQM